MDTTPTPAPNPEGLVDRWDAAFDKAFSEEGAEQAPSVDEILQESPEKVTPAKAPTLDDFINLEDTPDTEEVEEDPLDTEEDPIEGLDDDEDDTPEDVIKQGDKAVETWKTLKQEKKTLNQKVKALEAELTAAKKAPATPTAELAVMQKRIAEQERIIAAVQVSESEEYRQAVRSPLIAIEEKARSLTQDEDQEELIIEALADTNPKTRIQKISEAAEGMSDFAKNEFYSLVREIDGVFAKKQEIFSRSVEARKELDIKKLAEQGRETQQQREARIAATDKVWGNVVQRMPWMLDDNGSVKPEFAKIKEGIGDDLTSNSPIGTQVFASMAAHLVPTMAKEISSRDAEIATLKKSVAALKGASPRKGGGGNPTSTPSASNGKSFMERLDNAFADGTVK